MHRSNIRTLTDHPKVPRILDSKLISNIDFKAAFDRVHRESLWNILIMYEIPDSEDSEHHKKHI